MAGCRAKISAPPKKPLRDRKREKEREREREFLPREKEKSNFLRTGKLPETLISS